MRLGGFFMAVRPSRNGKKRRIVVYDTTLRDGAQGSFVTFSVTDKVLIARALDKIGVDYVEGGFPGSNPKEEEFFASLVESPLKRSRLAAFGATRRAGGTCEGDANLAALARSGAPTRTLVGKSDTWQVDRVLQTTLDENLAMIRESVAFGVASGHEVAFDAEHFFDAMPSGSVARVTDLSRTVAEIANLALPAQQPFVGQGAFAHKGGQHVAAVLKDADAYQHIDPALVGNQQRVLVSELSGRGSVLTKAREFGLEIDREDPETRRIVQHLKELEHRGYSYEAADASFELLLRRR